MKICKECNELLPLTKFGKKSSNKDGYKAVCHVCYRDINNEYKRSKTGLPTRIFNNQKVNSKRRNMAAPSYSVKELREWLLKQKNFEVLYEAWRNSGFDRELVPSCDRIDDNLPYTLENITLTTGEKNKQKAHQMVRDNKLKNPTLLNGGHRPVEKWTKDGSELLKTYPSQAEAVRQNPSIHQANIQKVCAGKIKSTGGFHWKYVGHTKAKQ